MNKRFHSSLSTPRETPIRVIKKLFYLFWETESFGNPKRDLNNVLAGYHSVRQDVTTKKDNLTVRSALLHAAGSVDTAAALVFEQHMERLTIEIQELLLGRANLLQKINSYTLPGSLSIQSSQEFDNKTDRNTKSRLSDLYKSLKKNKPKESEIIFRKILQYLMLEVRHTQLTKTENYEVNPNIEKTINNHNKDYIKKAEKWNDDLNQQLGLNKSWSKKNYIIETADYVRTVLEISGQYEARKLALKNEFNQKYSQDKAFEKDIEFEKDQSFTSINKKIQTISEDSNAHDSLITAIKWTILELLVPKVRSETSEEQKEEKKKEIVNRIKLDLDLPKPECYEDYHLDKIFDDSLRELEPSLQQLRRAYAKAETLKTQQKKESFIKEEINKQHFNNSHPKVILGCCQALSLSSKEMNSDLLHMLQEPLKAVRGYLPRLDVSRYEIQGILPVSLKNIDAVTGQINALLDDFAKLHEKLENRPAMAAHYAKEIHRMRDQLATNTKILAENIKQAGITKKAMTVIGQKSYRKEDHLLQTHPDVEQFTQSAASLQNVINDPFSEKIKSNLKYSILQGAIGDRLKNHSSYRKFPLIDTRLYYHRSTVIELNSEKHIHYYENFRNKIFKRELTINIDGVFQAVTFTKARVFDLLDRFIREHGVKPEILKKVRGGVRITWSDNDMRSQNIGPRFLEFLKNEFTKDQKKIKENQTGNAEVRTELNNETVHEKRISKNSLPDVSKMNDPTTSQTHRFPMRHYALSDDVLPGSERRKGGYGDLDGKKQQEQTQAQQEQSPMMSFPRNSC